MKKKTIEGIGYLKLPQTSRKKDVKYIGVTAVKNVAHKRHFFLEVYRNDKTAKDVPVVRVVVNKKDFGTYFPESGTWSRARITSNDWYDEMIWQEAGSGRGKTYQDMRKENILYSAEDLNRLKRFFVDVKVWNEEDWWEYINKSQDAIVYKERRMREHRRYERRQQALKDRMDHTPELPEQEILSWADKKVFKLKHYIYYRKKGRRVTICCSACGGVKEGPWKAGEMYESMAEGLMDEPKDKHLGICPMCRAWGTYKPQGKARSQYSIQAHTFKADKYKETGAVIRYIQLEKSWVLHEMVNKKGEPVMTGAYEKLEGVEIARTYMEEGKKPQTDFQKHNGYSGKDFWDDCNLYGMNNIMIDEASLYPGFSEELKGTILQYSAIELYEAAVGQVNAKDYLERYQDMPQIEMLVKLNLYEIVGKLTKCYCGIVADSNADRPDEFLGIRKEKLKLLIKHGGNERLLDVMKMEKRMGQNWTDEQILAISETGATAHDIELVLGIMTLQKALNAIVKYAGCEFGTGCTHAVERIRHTSRTYFDYLSMRAQLGYSLENTVYQRPRDLANAHNKMITELDKKRQEKRLSEVEEKFPLIRKNYRKLRKRFLFEDDSFIIRPARSAEEIVQEGRILHHCVGGDNYLGKHNRQESIILMLRFKETPKIPYVTVEISGERILQWYGAHDKKPDEKNIQKWLDAYVTRLKCEHPLNGLRKLDVTAV